ncbi:MAG TPA: glutamate-5-semialdehyde dehydrogenase [Candidatus Pullichristensenella excrementigallinarum]|uniref:Gamma-glutamyl phosphate reductase n=1 Tax=Candidatus Pullichristensenella excrementigallinarum TaxID=2840907 RepID=A0A9D1I9P5_9FIRM|nr:glutamate-5-semialdehyde dehydrogenase [Candidatus Pullichristensenella excrementigallinarum]
MIDLNAIGRKARAAQIQIATASSAAKNRALEAIADSLLAHTEQILEANARDLDAARASGMSPSLMDRLALTQVRVQAMAQGVRDVASLPDPVGRILSGGTLKSGLEMQKITVPLGVIGIIYEARPNVTSDAAAICLKSGNACILRGGKEAIHSNTAVANAMRAALPQAGFDENCVTLIEDTSRETSRELMRLHSYIDCLIPRGGAGLIRSVVENATVPVIETGVGNCHAYIDRTADLEMATEIVFNAKCSRPSVCNALETLLVDAEIAPTALPRIYARLQEKNVEFRGCEKTCRLLPQAVPATQTDYEIEFLDYILAVKVVEGLDEALEHIRRFSSHHSEVIVTRDLEAARRFALEVDSAAVYVNASTRFTDGGEFGLGAEIGISTQKLHARGPMGLEAMVSYKYVLYGQGQVR